MHLSNDPLFLIVLVVDLLLYFFERTRGNAGVRITLGDTGCGITPYQLSGSVTVSTAKNEKKILRGDIGTGHFFAVPFLFALFFIPLRIFPDQRRTPPCGSARWKAEVSAVACIPDSRSWTSHSKVRHAVTSGALYREAAQNYLPARSFFLQNAKSILDS